jgi:hypothetical protein
MKTDEYKIMYEITLPGGYDGVQVSYVHPTTNKKMYINYRILNGAITESGCLLPFFSSGFKPADCKKSFSVCFNAGL